MINLLLFASLQMEHSKTGNIWSYKSAKYKLEKMTDAEKEKTKKQQFLQIALYQQKAKDYRKDYTKKIERIRADADSMQGISIFQKRHSFAQKNMEKTVRDFQNVKTIALEEGEDLGIEGVTQYWYWTVAVLIFGFVLVSKLNLREQTSLSYVIRSSYAGREKLCWKQLRLLFGSTVVFGSLLWISLLIFSCVLYGFDVNWNRSLQSIPLFANVTFHCKIWRGLLLQGAIGILGALVGILVIYVLVLLLNHRQIIYASMAFLYGVGYFFSRAFVNGKKGEVLGLCNFYTFLKPGQILTEYHNYNWFGIPLGTLKVFLMVAIGVLLFSSIVSILLSKFCYLSQKKHSFGLTISLEWQGKTIIGLEVKQLLWDRKGIWLLMFSMLVMRFLSVQAPVSYNGEQRALNAFYRGYGGVMDDRFYARLDEMQTTYVQLQNQSKQNEEGNKTGKIEQEKYKAKVYELQKKMEAYGIVEPIEKKVKRLKKLQQSGKKVSFVEERGYEHLKNKTGKRKWETPIFLLLVFALQLGMISDLKNKSWRQSLRATYKGRNYVFWKKGILLFMVSLVFCLLLYAVDVYSINQVYPLQQWNAPIASLELGKNVWINVSIGCYFLTYYMVRACLYALLGFSIYLVEYKKRVQKN